MLGQAESDVHHRSVDFSRIYRRECTARREPTAPRREVIPLHRLTGQDIMRRMIETKGKPK